MATFQDRLKELRKERGLTQSELATYTKIPRASIAGYETKGVEADYGKLQSLANYFNVSIDYMLGKEDNIPKYTRIPVLGKVQAGLPCEAVENIIDYEEIPAELTRNGEYFALRVNGSSMEPRMHSGDVVIVKKTSQVENGKVAVVLVNGEEATLKVWKADESGVSLVPFNENFPELHYSPKQVQNLPVSVIGQVVELRAKF